MFPASAGMNRIVKPAVITIVYVPRERGDEPAFQGAGGRT